MTMKSEDYWDALREAGWTLGLADISAKSDPGQRYDNITMRRARLPNGQFAGCIMTVDYAEGFEVLYSSRKNDLADMVQETSDHFTR